MRHLLLILLITIAGVEANAQQKWQLKKDEEGIKVYTANTENSNFKSIKVECTVKATATQLIAFLLDLTKQHEWVYGTKSTTVLKVIRPNEMVFYSEVSVPWPCTNRDYISQLTINQVSPQLVTIDAHAEPNFLPAKPGLVRVQKSVAHWEITPTATGSLIVYTLQFDPGGSVPAWLTNLFVTKGPYETFQKLRTEVAKPEYQTAHVDFIK